MLVANISVKFGVFLHYTHTLNNHICIYLVLLVLLIKYQNLLKVIMSERKILEIKC